VRVVHVGKFYPPEYEGGLETVVVTLSDQLRRLGVDVTAVVAATRGAGGAGEYRGARVVRAATLGTVLSQPLAPSLPGRVRAEPGDVLHVHHPNPLADWAALADGRPFIVTHHSDIVRQRALGALYRPLLARALRRAAAVVTGSEQLRASSADLAPVRERVRVIPFGIEGSAFAATPATLARAGALRAGLGGRPVVLAVGRLVGYKGFDVLARAARGLDAAVVVVGTGPEETRLRALAGPAVTFAGRVAHEDLVAWYHACDVFCLPSVTSAEAFGVVLLEAMACGKPLVTTALPTGVAAVNRDGRTGLVVPPGDADALREALRALLGDAARRQAMGEEARAVRAREYDAALMGERYLRLYEEAAAAGATARRGPGS
jgi:rhamnosyl/mannosyltransferase